MWLPGASLPGAPSAEDLLDGVLRAANAALLVVDARGVVLSADDELADALGGTSAAVVGRSLVQLGVEFTDSEGVPIGAEVLPGRRAIITGRRAEAVISVRAPGRSARWQHVTAVPLRHPGEDRSYAALSVVIDVTESRRAAREARRVTEVLRSFLDAAAAPMWVTDADGRYLIVNDAACATILRGHRPDELVGRRVAEVFDGELAAALEGADAEVARSGRSVVVEEDLEVDGEVRTYVTTRFPLPLVEPGADGMRAEPAAVAIGGIATDITWRRETEWVLREREAFAQALVTELELTNEELRRADAIKDELLAMTSHELRTPLSAILGFTSILLRHRDRLDEVKQTSYLESVLGEAQRLNRLVEDLLTLSRIKAGAERVVRGQVRLRDVIDRVDSVLPEARLTVRCPDDVVLSADAGRLEQVFTNLVENAMRYGGGDVEVDVSAAGPTVEVRVRDHGPGVPAEFVPELFSSFTQASTGTTRTSQGSGLGLAVVRGLVEAHGGTVGYEDAPGGGALFIVRLPGR